MSTPHLRSGLRTDKLHHMETQQDIDRTAEAIYRDKVLRARARTMDEKLIDGLDCFETSCLLMADGVRQQFHLNDEAAIWKKVRERLDIVRRMEEHGIYQPVTVAP
jgi:hypothetical protein